MNDMFFNQRILNPVELYAGDRENKDTEQCAASMKAYISNIFSNIENAKERYYESKKPITVDHNIVCAIPSEYMEGKPYTIQPGMFTEVFNKAEGLSTANIPKAVVFHLLKDEFVENEYFNPIKDKFKAEIDQDVAYTYTSDQVYAFTDNAYNFLIDLVGELMCTKAYIFENRMEMPSCEYYYNYCDIFYWCAQFIIAYLEVYDECYNVLYHAANIIPQEARLVTAVNQRKKAEEDINHLNDLKSHSMETGNQDQTDNLVSIIRVREDECSKAVTEEAEAQFELDSAIKERAEFILSEFAKLKPKFDAAINDFKYHELLNVNPWNIGYDDAVSIAKNEVNYSYCVIHTGKLSAEAVNIIINEFVITLNEVFENTPFNISTNVNEFGEINFYVNMRDDKAPDYSEMAKSEYKLTDYCVNKENGYYSVTSPDGRFLGNCDGSADISQTIKEDYEGYQYARAIYESTLSAKDRSKLDEDEFGVPSLRAYPLNDEAHIRKAIQLFGHCKADYREELARNIKKAIIAKKLVGKVTIGSDHKYANLFPEWMQDPKAKASYDGNKYVIVSNGRNVEKGTIQTKKRPTNESALII